VKGILARHVVHHTTRVLSSCFAAGKTIFSKQGCLETFDSGGVAEMVGSGVGVVGWGERLSRKGAKAQRKRQEAILGTNPTS
jgi:hypothetical protein